MSYPSWDAFLKGGAVEAVKQGKSVSVYTWTPSYDPASKQCRAGMGLLRRSLDQAAFVIKFYRTLPFPAWWPWLCGRPKRVWPIGVALEKAAGIVPAHAALVRSESGVEAIVTEYLRDAVTFYAFAAAGRASKAHFDALGRLLGRLHRLGVVHGDMKWSNIMVTEPDGHEAIRFWLVDLDGAFRMTGVDPEARARDVARFTCDAIKEGVDKALLVAFRRGYHQDWPMNDGLEREVDRRLEGLLRRKGFLNARYH